MPEQKIKFYIEGPEAKAISEELSDFLKKEFSLDANIEQKKTSHGSTDKSKSFTETTSLLITTAQFIISIPATILVISDLIDRMGKKKSIDKLIQMAVEKHKENPESIISIETKDGTRITIHQSKSHELLDALDISKNQ